MSETETRDVPPRFGRDDVAVGDVVQWRGTWHPVVRVNAKTVTVPSIVGGSWTDRLPYDEITEVRRRGRASKADGVRNPGQPGSETAS